MRKLISTLVLIIGCLFNEATYANWFQDIINVINQQSAVVQGLLSNQISLEKDILTSQRDIDGLMKQLNGHVTGHSGWGDYGFHDYQSYGDSAKNWASVLQMADMGQGAGELGAMIGEIASQFPSALKDFNKGVSDTATQKYYALKAQTVIAERAASELDYNKIQSQISYQQMLGQQIEKTKDLKAAIDLLNRIQVEGNLISLEILRQSALSSQQQAVTEQAALSSALANAKFLTKE